MDSQQDQSGNDADNPLDNAASEPGGAAPSPDYPAVLDRVPAIIYVADAGHTGRWHYVSPQIQAILGYSPAEWCADPKLWANRLHPDDRERVLKHEANSEDRAPGTSANEYRMLHRGG